MADATIYAPATAPGRAAIAVLRVSGPGAAAAARLLTGRPPPPPRTATLCRLRDPASGEAIDAALLLYLPAPRSPTGEDVLEIQHHGSPAVLKALVEALGRESGFRPAGPGEFTRRGFLNGKLDLTAAEGLADLVEASTRSQARQALRQLDGELGRLYHGWRECLLDALALTEAEIDFAPDQAVPEGALAAIMPTVERLREEMAGHLADAGRGERLRAGVVVAVVGPPNVGKSSLVNALARRDVAIVTPIAGTTRDVIEVQLDLGGVPVTVLDTAGLRETRDPVEAEGVARARRRAAEADLRLYVVDSEDLPPVPDDGMVLVRNKSDLMPAAWRPDAGVAVSCRTGGGLAELERLLTDRTLGLVADGSAPILTRARHRAAVADAAAALERCLQGAAVGSELALLAEDVRIAARAIGQVTGAIGVESVLDRVFATFCIGK